MSPAVSRTEPIKILIAALGGEGGGVLATWLHAAAIAEGHLTHGTSIPGVAQRTGATTYYLELVPNAGRTEPDAALPIFALNAAPGEVDLVVATELLEGARALQAGFVTPDRTTLILSSTRVYTIDEKSAPGDGRINDARTIEVVGRYARKAFVTDMGAIAQECGCAISAVCLGAIAATGVLPVSDTSLEGVIVAGGKAVEQNLRGFRAGRKAFAVRPHEPQAEVNASGNVDAAEVDGVPFEAQQTVVEGLRRLEDYQDQAFAQTYLAIVRRFAAMPAADAPFIRELARHLALRMSVEDVIRVAQLKLRETRVARIRAEARSDQGDIVDVTEYLKPGPEEILGLLPARIAGPVLKRVRGNRGWAMTIRSTRFTGFLRLRMLASLRRFRRKTWQFAREEAWRRRWLELVEQALSVDPVAAREVVALAGLVRGYGDTYKRGLANYDRIVGEVVDPMLTGRLSQRLFADAVLQARLAALKDAEGETLPAMLAAMTASAGNVAVQTAP